MKKTLMEIPTSQPDHFIVVKLYYDKGGYSYATYKQKERGYYLSVLPQEITRKDGITMTTTTAFSGYYQFIQPAKRFNQKIFDTFQPEHEILHKLITSVCDKNNIALSPEGAEQIARIA